MFSPVQNDKTLKNKKIPEKYPFLTTPSEQISYRYPSANVLLQRALSEPKRRGLRPECHPDELAQPCFHMQFLFIHVDILYEPDNT